MVAFLRPFRISDSQMPINLIGTRKDTRMTDYQDRLVRNGDECDAVEVTRGLDMLDQPVFFWWNPRLKILLMRRLKGIGNWLRLGFTGS